MKRDEVSRLEAAVRHANPVPRTEAVRMSDEATAVTLLVEKRRRTMTSPTQTTRRPTSQPLHRRRSMAWAFTAGFASALLLIAAALLLLRGEDRPLADGAVSPTTPAAPITVPEELTAVAQGQWDWLRVDAPWLASVVDMAPLPQGGFVVAATDEWSVLWSSDGIEWRDADPRREVTVLPMGPGHMGPDPQVVTTINGGVAVLDRTLFGIKVGELNTGNWESVEFDTSDLTGAIGLLALASNESHVLVIGSEDDYSGEVAGLRAPFDCGEQTSFPDSQHSRYLSWLVDTRTGEIERGSIPASSWEAAENEWDRRCGAAYVSLAWFKGHWVLDVGHMAAQGFWFVSEDGTTWTRNPVPADSDPGAATLMAGPDALLAEGDAWGSLCYSENGIDWTGVGEDDDRGVRPPRDAVAYSEVFGYLATPWSDSGLYMSDDGRTWYYIADWPGVDDLIASGDRAFGINREFSVAYSFVYNELGEGSGSNEAGPFVVSFSTVVEAPAATESGLVTTFRLEGRAVDDGVICPSATATRSGFVDLDSGPGQWTYTMVCNDGSGTFKADIESEGWGEPDRSWAYLAYTVIDGSGDYRGMSGYGTGMISCGYAGGADRCLESFGGTFRWRQ